MSVRLSIVTLGTTFYGQDLVYPSWDFVFLLHMERTYIEAVRRRIIFEQAIVEGKAPNLPPSHIISCSTLFHSLFYFLCYYLSILFLSFLIDSSNIFVNFMRVCSTRSEIMIL